MSEKVQTRLSFIINVAFIAVVVTLIYLAFKFVIGWVLPFLLAFGMVSLIHPLIRVIKKNLKIKQEIISLLVMILIYALVGVIIFLLIMQVVILIRDNLPLLPDYYKETMEPAIIRAGDSLIAFIHNLPPEWQEQITGFQDQVLSAVQTFLIDLSQRGVSFLSSLTTSVPSFMIAFVFTIMLSFFICMQYDKVVTFISVQLPEKVKSIIKDLRGIVMETVVKYFKAALTLMFITFIELSVGLLALSTKNAIPIAAGIAIFDALPFFGTGAIMIPWLLIELLQANYRFAFGLAILYAIVTVIRNFIEPKVVGDKLGLNPIVSLSAIYLGFKLFGVLGMIVMPILTQIVMELHHKGTIRLFREVARKEDALIPEQSDDKSRSEEEPHP